MRNELWAMSVLALAVAVAPACATKKFVRGEVGNVNSKVDTLSRLARGDAGADAQQRRAHRRGGPEGRGGRPVGAGRARRGGRGGGFGTAR